MPRPWRQPREMTAAEKEFVSRQVVDVEKRELSKSMNQLRRTEEGRQLLQHHGHVTPAAEADPQTHRARLETIQKNATTPGKLLKTITGAPVPPPAPPVNLHPPVKQTERKIWQKSDWDQRTHMVW